MMARNQEHITRDRLDHLCSLVTDGTHDSPKLQPKGIPFIKGKHISGGFVDFDNCDYITLEDHIKAIQRSKPEYGDILFSNIGSVGDAAYINTRTEFSIKNVALFKPNPRLVDSKYLYYIVIGPKFKGELIGKRSGVAQPFFSLEMLRSHEVEYHRELNTQRKIAAILSAYDDLIENNLRRIKILEEMAQNLYRDWFVKFRYPGHEDASFVDSTMGRIPKGWEVATLGDCCELVMGQSPKSEFYNESGEGLPFHQGVTNFGDRFPTDRVYCTITERIAEEGDILFSVRAPVGRINIALHRLVIGRGVAAIRSRDRHQFFILHQLKEVFCEEDSIGNGAIFKAVTKSDLMGVKLVKPASPILSKFDSMAHSIGLQIKTLTAKNTTLRRTRDLLLPRLISGEVDVSELDITLPEEADA